MDEQGVLSEAYRLRDSWNPRVAIWEEDNDLLNVKQYPKPPNEEYRFNEARVLFDISRGLLSMGEVHTSLPQSVQPEEQKVNMDKAERFCSGALRELDRTRMLKGHGKFLEELAHWSLRGFIAGFPRVEEDKKGQPIFCCDLYDPSQVYPEFGSQGILHVARIYKTTPGMADSMIEEGDWKTVDLPSGKDATVEIVNYWEKRKGKVYNTVLVGGQESRKEEEDYEEIPILFLPVHGNPQRGDTLGSNEWVASMGECILADNRKIYPIADRYRSLMMQIASDAAWPKPVHTRRPGSAPLSEEQLGTKQAVSIEMGEKIEYLKASGNALAELQVFMADISGILQRGGLSNIASGNLQFPLSGYAIYMLKELEQRLGPYRDPIEFFYSETLMTWMREFRKGKFKPVTLAGRRFGTREGYMQQDFTKKDIPDVLFVKVNVGLGMEGIDKAQNVQMANMLWGRISDRRIMQEYLGIEDTKVEKDWMIDDMADAVMAGIKLAVNLKQAAAQANLQANALEAQGRTGEAERMRWKAQWAEVQAERAMAGVGGGGAPPQRSEANLPPETLPPEMSGENPDEMAAMQGRAPTPAGEGER